MRAKIFAFLILLIATTVARAEFPFSLDSESIIVRSWHFPAVNEAPYNSAGTALSVACAAPPYVNMGTAHGQPFLIAPSANTTKVGEHGIFGAVDYSNLCQRALFTSWDDANTPTGWTDTETAGDGSASISAESTIIAAGTKSVKMVLTGTTSVASVDSACITCTASTCNYDMYATAFAKKASGTTVTEIDILEYDTDACGAYLQTQTVQTGDITTGWLEYGGLAASASFHANSSSVLLRLKESGDGGVTMYFDAPQLRAASTAVGAFALCDTDATCATNDVDITDDNPPINVQGTWEFEATIRSPMDGAVGGSPHRRIIYVPGTAGNNNRILFYWSSDLLTCTAYDSAGAAKTSTVAAAGNANTDYVVKMSKSAGGVVQCCFNGTCDATPATGALADGIGSELVFSGSGSTGAELWIDEPVIRRRLTP